MFFLADENRLSLVFTTEEIDDGLAAVKGVELPKFTWKDDELSVILAESVTLTTTGTPATVSEILTDPDKYTLKLVKIDATLRQVSLLLDPDDGSNFGLPATIGARINSPKSNSMIFNDLKAKMSQLQTQANREIADDIIGQTMEPHLNTSNLKTDYWLDSEVEVNGIVLPPRGGIEHLLKNLGIHTMVYPEDSEKPPLYAINTELESTQVSSIQEINLHPDKYTEKVVTITANAYTQTTSPQETKTKKPPT